VAAVDEVGKHVDLARQSIAQERWQVAIDEARAALAVDASSKEAQALLAQATSELGQEKLFTEFGRAAASKQLAKVAGAFAKFDPDSVYRVKAQPEHDRLKADYLRAQGEAGRKLAERGKCRDQRRLAVAAEAVWGTDARAAVLANECKEIAVDPTPPNPGTTTPNPGTTTPPVETGPGPDELLAEARQAAKDDQFGKALRLCQAALGKRPGDSEAAQICVIAACNLKSAPTAKKYLDKVKSESRVQALKQICLGKGVEL
jgi:hypothetical protein